MLIGGLLASHRVADTMARHITEMNPGSATTANLTASGLVILASFLALPVATTHVSCGALFGIGLTQRRANWPVIGSILLAWVTTLPLAAGLAFLITWAVRILS
jgi:inorganic phosphate transporter, PiT family